jgi:hypothetical protein
MSVLCLVLVGDMTAEQGTEHYTLNNTIHHIQLNLCWHSKQTYHHHSTHHHTAHISFAPKWLTAN